MPYKLVLYVVSNVITSTKNVFLSLSKNQCFNDEMTAQLSQMAPCLTDVKNSIKATRPYTTCNNVVLKLFIALLKVNSVPLTSYSNQEASCPFSLPPLELRCRSALLRCQQLLQTRRRSALRLSHPCPPAAPPPRMFAWFHPPAYLPAPGYRRPPQSGGSVAGKSNELQSSNHTL